MSEVRITCINKDGGNHNNPHEAIENYGWQNPGTGSSGISQRYQMVEWLENGNHAYVQDANHNKAYCKVRVSAHGNKFLQTIADGQFTNNLLNLPECS